MKQGLESFLLKKVAHDLPSKGGKEVLKSHFVCRLHQLQLSEVLLVAVAGAWLMSRLYSLTLLLQQGGMFFRLTSEFGKLMRAPGHVIVKCAP